MRFALKRMAQDPTHPVGRDDAWRESLEKCLGEDAADLKALASRKSQSLGGNIVPMGLGDFFFSPDDPLHPDADFGEFDDDDDDDDDDETGRRRRSSDESRPLWLFQRSKHDERLSRLCDMVENRLAGRELLMYNAARIGCWCG